MAKVIIPFALLGLAATAFFVAQPALGSSAAGAKTSRAYLHSHNLPADGVALDGYCPVAYFAVNKPVRGKKEYAADHNGITYHFVSAEARDMFTKKPAQYVPAFGGWCAFGMAVKDKFPVDPTNFKIVDGKLLLFLRNSNVDAQKIWNGKKEDVLLEDAAAHWKTVQG